MHLDDRFRFICSEIEDCIDHGKKDYYIYPFGAVGTQVKDILNKRYGIIEKGIIDNYLAYYNSSVLKISDLTQEDLNAESKFQKYDKVLEFAPFSGVRKAGE